MPFNDPELSPNPRYQVNLAGPAGSFFDMSLSVSTPPNDSGISDPVERDAAFQSLVNQLEALAGYTVSNASKATDAVQYCTPDIP